MARQETITISIKDVKIKLQNPGIKTIIIMLMALLFVGLLLWLIHPLSPHNI